MPNTHYSLNSKQLGILQLLYRFRFGTTELIAQALAIKTKNKMNERLKILLDQEYIGRNYEPEYRLLRKHATYYLLPKGIKALKEHDDKCDKAVLHNIYKDKTASKQFIDRCLATFKTYCELRTKHGDNLRFFTKSQLNQFEYFPKPLPDAYARVKTARSEKQYFLEVLHGRPFFISVRKLRHYIAYADSGEWEDTGTHLPTVVLLCDSDTLKKRLDKQLEKLGYDIDPDELQFLTTTRLAEII